MPALGVAAVANPAGIGYPDGQRVSNFTGPTLWSSNTGPVALVPALRLGPFDVSRYGFLGGSLQVSGGFSSVVLTWYEDQAEQYPIATREFFLAPNITEPAQIHLPNLGPYVSILASSGESGATLTGQLLGTNTPHPLEFIPVNTQFVYEYGKAINANTAIYLYPTDYYSGALHVWYESNGAMFFIIETLQGDGVWNYHSQLATPSAGAQFDQTILVPGGAWRWHLANTGTSSLTYYLAASPSPNGSS